MVRMTLILFLALSPAAALAQACEGPEDCPNGTIWNPLTQSCGPLVMA